MQKVIKETSDYILATGISSSDETTCYQVINKVYDVIEAESHILPQGFEYLEQIQAALDARRDDEKALSDVAHATNDNTIQFPH